MAKGWFEAKDPVLGKARRHSEVARKSEYGGAMRSSMVREGEDWKAVAKRELEKELEVETEVSRYGFFEDLGALALESVSGEANNGEREWIVFPDVGTAESAAVAQVKQVLEDEPEIFSQDWLMGWIMISETDQGVIADGEASFRIEDMGDEDILREAGKEDEYNELSERMEEFDEAGKANSREYADLADQQIKLVDGAREERRLEIYNETYDALEDPIQYFVHDRGIYNVADLLKMPWIQIDVEDAAQDAVDTDGIAHFLDRYDSDEVMLPSGAVAYGTN